MLENRLQEIQSWNPRKKIQEGRKAVSRSWVMGELERIGTNLQLEDK